jgi:hypothetical protein
VYLRWSETPISFSRQDQWTSYSDPGRYPLVLHPVVAGSKLTGVLVNGGSELNMLFAKTSRKMGFNTNGKITPTNALFCSIVPGNQATSLGHITLPVTFGTRENYRTEYIRFEVADFESSYHAILGRPAIAKFMAVPHYTYLMLKMPMPKGVLSLKGGLKRSHDCDTEAVEIASTCQVRTPMQEVFTVAQGLGKEDLEIPSKKQATTKAQPAKEDDVKAIDLGTGDSSKTALIGTRLDPK